jgi:NADH:ubiquinone oxidoreductase subunit 6 (subunit J)
MKTIKLPLYFGALYFVLISLAHALNIKIPGLFIYFNVPSYAYQDKIISFLTFGWAVFFFTAAKTLAKPLIQSIIIIGAVAIVMLFYINMNTDFISLSSEINPDIFFIETGILFLYWTWLVWSYINARKKLVQS